jgi:hypothetical protein
MANSLKTLNDGDITREALRVFKNSNAVIGAVNRQYDDRFARSGAKNGGTLQIRLPNRYTVGTGATVTPQDTEEKTTALVVATQKNVSTAFTSVDLTLSLDDFSDRILKPAMSILASAVALDIATVMAKGFHQLVGTAGTHPSSFLTYADAGGKLDWQTAPRDDNRCIVLNPAAMVATVDANKGLFAPSGAIGDQYTKGVVEQMTGFKFMMDQSLPTITNGAGTGYQTNTPTFTSGSSSIAVDTGTGALNAGQVFTIATVFEINPDTGQSTGQLKQFVVAADYAGGAGSISITQPIYTSGPYKNVTPGIPDNQALTFVGSVSTAYTRNFAFHRDAVVLATADLELSTKAEMHARAAVDGLSMRLHRDYDILNDKFIDRFDILYGIKVVRPEWGVQIIGA